MTTSRLLATGYNYFPQVVAPGGTPFLFKVSGFDGETVQLKYLDPADGQIYAIKDDDGNETAIFTAADAKSFPDGLPSSFPVVEVSSFSGGNGLRASFTTKALV